MRRALGVGAEEVVANSNDPRFLTTTIPSGNVVTTANELSPKTAASTLALP
jgi:hypothetical protein